LTIWKPTLAGTCVLVNLTCARLIVQIYYIFTYSTYITGGGGGGLGNPALSSIDEAYHFYGMRNPLEPEGSGGKIIRIIRKICYECNEHETLSYIALKIKEQRFYCCSTDNI